MLQPNELKKKAFTKAVRGYSQTEVDEYIEFLVDQYTQLYKQNADLEKRLHVVSARYEEIANEEESIRSAVLKAQKLSEVMVSKAKKQADDIIFTIDERCKNILAENAKKIEEQKAELRTLRRMSGDFRESLYSQYLTHVKLIKDMDLPSPDTVDEDLAGAVTMIETAMDGLSPKQQVMAAAEEAVRDVEAASETPLPDTDEEEN